VGTGDGVRHCRSECVCAEYGYAWLDHVAAGAVAAIGLGLFVVLALIGAGAIEVLAQRTLMAKTGSPVCGAASSSHLSEPASSERSEFSPAFRRTDGNSGGYWGGYRGYPADPTPRATPTSDATVCQSTR
jgi:hypothetical protein